MNYDNPRQYVNFTGTDFLIFILVRRHVTFKLRAFQIRQTNFASYEELTGSPVFFRLHLTFSVA